VTREQRKLTWTKRWSGLALIPRLKQLLYLPANTWRRRFTAMDYALFHLPATITALPEQRSWLQRRLRGEAPLSIYHLGEACRRIGADPRLQGIVLSAGGRNLHYSQADVQALGEHLQTLRRNGKRVVFFAHNYHTTLYSLACAADTIVLQPGGEVATTGLHSTITFHKDALAAIGIAVEKVAISPYKSAADIFCRSTISPEGEVQFNWLLDSLYDTLISTIAAGRGMTTIAVRAMIDGAPYTDQEALAAGYVDAVRNEEGLAELLGARHILPWREVARKLPRTVAGGGRRHVAVVAVQGAIVPGKSRRPPLPLPIPLLGGGQAGDETVIRQIRQVQRDPRAAALLLFVDSPGGSASGSEAIAAALEALAQTRPVVVCMHNLAASGGYYVATPACWLVAQPGTITGSIGVLSARAHTQELFGKLRLNRLEYSRGANAAIVGDLSPLSEAQRGQYQRRIESIYDAFVRRVAASRRLDRTVVDAVGGGRVWTGVQALDHRLLDQLGGLEAAAGKARSLAGLPEDAPLRLVQGREKEIGPPAGFPPQTADTLRYLQRSLEMFYSGKAQMLLPFHVEWTP
jgi:protease IV